MSTFVEFVNRAAETGSMYLLHAGWQAGLFGLCLLMAVLVGRRWPSPVRYWLLALAMVKFVIPPFLFLPFGVFGQFGPVALDVDSAAQASSREGAAPQVGSTEQPPTVERGNHPQREPATSSVAASGDLRALPPVEIVTHDAVPRDRHGLREFPRDIDGIETAALRSAVPIGSFPAPTVSWRA